MAEEKISAVIDLVDASSNKISKTISDISPDATGDQIVAFAKGLTSLTTNTYTGTTKVTKEELSSVAKLDPGLKWAGPGNKTEENLTVNAQTGGDSFNLASTLATDAVPYIKSNTSVLPATVAYLVEPSGSYIVAYAITADIADIVSTIDEKGLYPNKADATAKTAWDGSGDIVVAVDETDSYAAAEIVLHVTLA